MFVLQDGDDVATGSAPVELPFLPFDGERVISSTEALALDAVPELARRAFGQTHRPARAGQDDLRPHRPQALDMQVDRHRVRQVHQRCEPEVGRGGHRREG